jgi:Fungal kinase associated-1 domain
VSLRVEFYTVLLHGRNHNLSLARFVQEFGAKSSFEKATKTMEGVLRGRGVLVTKRKKARKMQKCLKEWEQRQ